MRVQKVMVVDDDPSIRFISETCLNKIFKFKVLIASSAREAIEKLKTDKPDVILLDIMMPVIDGKTAFPAIRKASGGEAVIIFMTGETDRAALEVYLKVGAAGIICKPFEITRLCTQVNEIAENHWSKGKPCLPAAAKRAVPAN